MPTKETLLALFLILAGGVMLTSGTALLFFPIPDASGAGPRAVPQTLPQNLEPIRLALTLVQAPPGLALVCLGGLLFVPGAYVSHLAYQQERLPEL